MSKRNIVVIFIIVILGITCITTLLLSRTIFKVRNVKITKDFEINKTKLLNYLEIYPLQPIWKYNTKEMTVKLRKQKYLAYAKVTKILPNTIHIKIKEKKPVICIQNNDNTYYLVDREGSIYTKVKNNTFTIPYLIIHDIPEINNTGNINMISTNLIQTITKLKSLYPDIYDILTHIEITRNRAKLVDYIVNFKTLSHSIYLKNSIDVDSIKRSLVCALFLENKNDYNDLLIEHTKNGFAY